MPLPPRVTTIQERLPIPVTLPAHPSSAAVARRILHESLGTLLDGNLLADVELMASELVANVALHARTACALMVAVPSTGVLRVSVEDFDHRRPAVEQGSPAAQRGRGLRLVEQLAERWGMDTMAGRGKVVWFEVVF